jgi:hypothetical protein
MRRLTFFCLALAVWSGGIFLFPPSASAIPAFARRYGVACSGCHTAWPALSADGWSFKMSGYRRLNGKELTPTTKDIDIAAGALSIPAIPPLAIVATFGFDFQEVGRRASDGATATRKGSSFDFNELELLAGAPLGKNLSFFLDYELFETEIENRSGPGEANETGSRRNLTFEGEGPGAPGLAMLIWNSVFPQSIAPFDSLNIVAGIYELPLGFSPEHRRLSASPYLIYERRGLDLLAGTPVEDLVPSAQRDRLFRLSKSQLGVELNGLLLPFGGAISEAPMLEYHLGIINGSNNQSDPNTGKDFFGRLAFRWAGQMLGVFGHWSPDIYSDDLRRAAPDGAAFDPATGEGALAGGGRRNQASAVGPDLTLSLEPFDIPVWLETQLLFNHESNPTGFNKSFTWWGGFTQLNWKIGNSLIAYGRYDWLRGDRFDDTGVGGVTGPVKPREWSAVGGLQWYVLENMKLLAEYSRHEFENSASSPSKSRLTENFVTLRVVLGF